MFSENLKVFPHNLSLRGSFFCNDYGIFVEYEKKIEVQSAKANISAGNSQGLLICRHLMRKATTCHKRQVAIEIKGRQLATNR